MTQKAAGPKALLILIVISAKEDVNKQLLIANIKLSILTLWQYVFSKKVCLSMKGTMNKYKRTLTQIRNRSVPNILGSEKLLILYA